ncbi:MOSC domain-containing protein [Acidithiobacillus thiooxidans]|uniref:MOSC domain-containing protein n=1 Tax=Acidithiobacillus thiooxidans TaxID=930 RepID=UPI000262546B|nr:MOSC domain-containing protein [Acidithiobacillus thiooxidans]MBU2812354.1 MOSC domain-containing protein [Acidithiobacillus thiooxidans]
MTPIKKSVAVQIFVGTIQLLPQSARPSGIYKIPTKMPVKLEINGFEGDHQADLRVHGGPDKAVQLYPVKHYEALAERFPTMHEKLFPGAIGENISCPDLDEHDVHIGDIWRLGEGLLQISQPRSPCWKIDEKLDCQGVAAYIAETSITGWYFRVLKAGMVKEYDKLELLESVNECYRLSSLLQVMRRDDPEAMGVLQKWMEAPGLADNLRLKIEKRIIYLKDTHR